ncbi:MAG: geranylgeranyl reductase family protein [Nitrososphaeria archaeon]
MPDYDVIIIGGGPAGVAAAKSSAETGAKTLLVEREPAIAAWKPCGEATSLETFTDMGLKPDYPLIVRKANAMVFAPNGKYVTINQEGYSINKTFFLQEVAARAAQAGAEIHVREAFEGFERDGGRVKVKTSSNSYSAGVIIGADGYHSAVAKSAGIREKSEPIPTVQYIMANVKLQHLHSVRFYLGDSVAPKGYAWIFPKTDDIAEVGIGVRGVVAKQYLDKFVRDHLDELGNAKIIDYRGAPVPIGGLIKDGVRDNLILAGDAAGTVIPFTGAGIHSSLMAGLAAGRVAASASLDGNTSADRLSEFYRLYDDPWGKRIRSSLRAMKVFEKASDDDFNQLQEILDEGDILDLANGFDFSKVASKLMKHPMLAIKIGTRLLTS